jgi:FAD:protein FMN transferase
MGTRARILVVGEPHGLAERLRDRVVDLEARWSRFVDTSEISRLNRAAGATVAVSGDTLALLAHGMEGWEATYGLFDPTILGDLERAGYDRTFERVGGRDPETDELSRHPAAAGAWTVPASPTDTGSGPNRRSWLVRGCGDLELDHQAGTARLPAGVGFDPGGIGKGFAADLVAAEAMDAGAAGVLVDLGGDLRVSGEPPARTGPWRLGVDHPLGALDLASVALNDGAVATSTRTRRRWTTADGEQRHHLIDPLMGSPVDSDVVSATAVAARGWQAEVLAKAAFIGGPVQGLGLVHTLGGAAVVFTADGELCEGPDWHRFAARAA